MPRIPPFPSGTRDVINQIRNAVGRTITFYYSVGQTACTNTNPVCSLDPVNKLSTNPFCPICKGKYWIPGSGVKTATALITWGKTDQPLVTPAGVLDRAQGIATVEYDASYIGPSGVLKNLVSVDVDGRAMNVLEHELRGVPAVNRIRLYLEDKN